MVDIVFWRTGNPDWASASVWLGAGLVMAALAAVAGLIDVSGDARIRQLSAVWLHAGGNIVVVLLSLWNFIRRCGHADAATILPMGIVLSGIVVLILLFTGWLGWEMVYRHRVGVADGP